MSAGGARREGGSRPEAVAPARAPRLALLDVALPFAVFAVALGLCLRTMGRVFVPALDEGVYLEAARLMADGVVPYRDFFLSHPPWTMLAAGAVLELSGGSVDVLDGLYAAWVLSAVFPIATLVRALTASRAAALAAAALYAFSPALLKWQARFFGVREAALPLLAGALLALLGPARRPVAGGVLLGLFSACVVPHVPIGITVAAALLFVPVLTRERSLGSSLRREAPALVAFVATLVLAYAVVLAIPGAWSGLVTFQAVKARTPVVARLLAFAREVLVQNVPLLLAGLAGSLLARGRGLPVAAVNLVALPVVLLLPHSYYPHYVGSFLVSLALAGGFAVARLGGSGTGRRVLAGLVGAALAVEGWVYLREPLGRTTPYLSRVVAALRSVPEPLLAFEPIYALRAGKALTFHRHVVDMRYFRSLQKPTLTDGEFLALLGRSRSVLVEPFLARTLTPERSAALVRDFVPVFRDDLHLVLVRRHGAGGAGKSP